MQVLPEKPEQSRDFQNRLSMKRKSYRIFVLAVLCMTGIQNSIAQLNYDRIYKYSGNGGSGPFATGSVATARAVNPSGGIAIDREGNMYMGEDNQIVKIDVMTGITSVIAGTGVSGFSGDGGFATSAKISGVLDIAVDMKTNEIYFIDQFVGGGPGGLGSGTRIRKIMPAFGGTIVTVAGTGTLGHSGDGGSSLSAAISARAIAIAPNSKLLIAESFYIREVNSSGVINTIAGSGATPYTISGFSGSALAANIDLGQGQIECDAYGNIYIAESPWHIIRKIDPVTNGIAIFAGVPGVTRGAPGDYTGDGGFSASAHLHTPMDLVFDSFGNMYIGDAYNFVVRKVTPGRTISTIAGNHLNVALSGLPAACGRPKETRIGTIERVAIDPDNCLYMFNAYKPVIWKISEGLKIKNIDINSLCAPGTPGATVTPKLTAYVTGGVPPYICYWEPLLGNNVTLDNDGILSPTITGIVSGGVGKGEFRLLLEDNSSCGVGAVPRQTKFLLNSSATFDLAMRDSYLDMYDEPNSQNFEHSPWDPDIWNRIFPDNRVNINQDPCFGGGSTMCNNHMYVTVRNVGCFASPAGKKVKMYWTVGGTEQKWPGNWTTDIYPGTSLPQGKEIASITLPSIAAGSKQEFKQEWVAPDPLAYTSSSNMGICFQGRIVDDHTGNTDGMTFEETEHVFRNMEYNNNIVLRNSKVVRIYHLANRKMTVLTGNVENAPVLTTLKLSNRDITASTLSHYVEMTVYLGNIYDLWVAGGSLGTYQETDPVAKTVTFNGTNEVRLDGILFPANYQYPVEIEFALKPGVDGTEMRTEYVYFQQFLNTQQGPKMHGSFEFILTYDGEEAPVGAYRAEGTNSVKQVAKVHDVKVFPNPTSATLNFEFPAVAETGTIVLVDISGHVVAEQAIKNQKTSSFDVKSLAPGVYIYRINSADTIQSGTVIVEK